MNDHAINDHAISDSTSNDDVVDHAVAAPVNTRRETSPAALNLSPKRKARKLPLATLLPMAAFCVALGFWLGVTVAG
jgi:hypothetical protein